jgi:hypothetical protein
MSEYSVLFNSITDAIKALQEMEEKLKFAQQIAEEIFIEKSESTSDNEKANNIIKLDGHI